ncbi:MAG: HAMP domain-containing protein, partial [Dehalococcoidia bacterium]|nr:HAMP domain-containing protein [Dehalococcoidia bacterium]
MADKLAPMDTPQSALESTTTKAAFNEVERKSGVMDVEAVHTGLLGLKGKFGILYLALVLVVISTMVLLTIINLTEALNNEYRDKATSIAQTFEAQYESLAEIQDARFTQTHIDHLISLNPNIYKVSLYVPVNGQVIRTASSNKDQIGEPADPEDAAPITTGQTIFADKIREGENMVEILAPIRIANQPVAALGIYLRLAPRDEVVRNQTLRIAAIGVVAAGFLLVVLYVFFDWLLLKPLAALQRSAVDIQRGQLSTYVKFNRRDEIGMLATVFNGMAQALGRREQENQELHEQLQEKYQEAQAMATIDVITGLYNHRYFQDALTAEIERAIRFQTPVALIFGD